MYVTMFSIILTLSPVDSVELSVDGLFEMCGFEQEWGYLFAEQLYDPFVRKKKTRYLKY